MSTDTRIVIARYDPDSKFGMTRYTARIVYPVKDLMKEESALERAQDCFLEVPNWPWFSTIGRAKTFARLLDSEYRPEFIDPIYIIISREAVYPMSKRGKRLPHWPRIQ